MFADYIHKKSLHYPSFLYYSHILYWQEGDHRTHIYSYNSNTANEKEIIILPTTTSLSLDDIAISPDQQKIAYILSEETEPGMGSSQIDK